MKAKTSDGLDLYYETGGNSAARETLVLLNGLTQSTQSWALVTPAFRTDYRIVLLDFVFQGQSSKEGAWRDFDRHAEDLKTVLDITGGGPFHVAGLSYGSLVAQHFAVNYPGYVKSLVLLSTFAHKTPYYEAVELAWWKALETGGYNLLLDIMLPTVLSEDYFSSPLIPIEEMKKARRDRAQGSEALFKLMKATRERLDYRAKLGRISAPVLIIQGEKDLLLPVHLAREVQASIPGSVLEVIQGAGHTLNIEKTDIVCGHMRKFIDGIR